MSVDLDESVVNPIFCKSLASEGFGLCDFVFVVGEDEVSSTTVDIDLLAKGFHIHCRAFDMPTGTAFAPR